MKEAADRVLAAAWDKASGGGRYPAAARQIYYAARGPLQDLTGKPVSYNYFAQTLLPDYIEKHSLTWDVVYDARGNFHEPHTGTGVPLGTLQVRSYLREVGNAVPVSGIPQIKLNTRVSDRRTAAPLRSGPVHRKGRLRSAAGSGADRGTVRHRHHEYQGHVGYGFAAARRGALRAPRHSPARPARFRRVRLHHRRHVAGVDAALSVHKRLPRHRSRTPARGRKRPRSGRRASRQGRPQKHGLDAQTIRRHRGRGRFPAHPGDSASSSTR